jgi:ddrB-like ParB superfamily domain
MSTPAVTPKIVQVPGVGNIQFPGDMPDDQVSAAIKKNYPQLSAGQNEKPAELMTPAEQMTRAKSQSYGTTSMGSSSTPYKPPNDPYAVKPNTVQSFVANAGIPTSQAATADAVRGMLTPQSDPAHDVVSRAVERVPIVGGDQRARVDLYRRGEKEGGTLGAAHKVAAFVPFAGPAVAASQDALDKGDYSGAAGSGVNSILSMMGLRSMVSPKTAPKPLTPETVTNPPTGSYTGPAIETPTTPSRIAQPRTSLPARATAKVLGGNPEVMQKTPLPQQEAAGSATNAQVAAYAQSKGIDLLAGQATGARGLQTLQAVGERAVVAPGDLPEVLDKQKAAFGNLVDDFKGRVSPATASTEDTGLSLQSQAHAGMDNLKSAAQDDYRAFQQAAGDLPVDLSDVKTKYAAKLAEQAEALKNVPAKYANPIKSTLGKLSSIEAGGEVDPKVLKDFNAAVEAYGLNPEQQAALRTKMGLPDEAGNSAVKMSTAQQLRSAYLDIARDYSGNVPKAVQRIAGEAANDIDAAMARAADSAGATEQWRAANAKWKQLQQTYNNPEHPLYKILKEPDSAKVPAKVLGKGDYGGSPQVIRQLKQAGIDLSPLKREVAQRIADKNFALTNGGRGLAGYTTPFLQELYSPAELQELQMMGRVGRAIRFEMNPSGTSNVYEGGHQLRAIMRHAGPIGAGGGAGFLLGGPVGAVIGASLAGGADAMMPSIASRITTSRALSRAAIGDLSKVQPQSVPAAPRGIMDILRGAPPEPQGGTPAAPASSQPVPVAPKAAAVAAKAKAEVVQPERGIKKPERRTFARPSDQDLKEFFSYRFDQLRNELKAAQTIGDEKVVADVQRRIDELAKIQNQPRSLMDVFSGKPPQTMPETAVTSAAEAAKDTGDFAQAKKNLPNGTVSQQLQEAQRLKTARTKPQAQSVNSAVREVLGENPSAEHQSTSPQQAMESRQTVEGNYGADTSVKTTTSSLPAKYKLIEADSLIPSHNAQTFAKNPQYPEGVQERAYHTSKEAQNRVIQQSQNYDPAYTVNTNPDAVNGPPVITKDGIVLGGNSRAMSTQRLYQSGGDVYKNYLRNNASQFGIPPAAVDNMRKPVLVREIETPKTIDDARRIGADLNKNMTGALGTGEKAVSAGRSVKPATLATISGMVNDMGEGATLRDAMRQHGKDIVNMMVKDGVISERERPQFVDTSTGGLNEEGKTFVERALVGSVVDDPRLMDRTPKSVLGKLEGSLGDLATIGARTDEYNILPIVREALAEHAEMAMRGLDVDKFLAQSNMFGQSANPAVEAMVRQLAGKPKAFRDALSQYAKDAKHDTQGQGLLGLSLNKPTPVRAFNEAFGTNLTDEQLHNALLQSSVKEGTIGISGGHANQTPRSNEGLRDQALPGTGAGSQRKNPAAQAGGKAANRPQTVEPQRSLSDIIGNRQPKRKK